MSTIEEKVTPWPEVPNLVKACIVDAFCTNHHLKSPDTIIRILKLSQPAVTIGWDGMESKYWRIDDENAVLLKQLLVAYL